MSTIDLEKITTTLKTGGIIIYPTETIYGLGCDPFNLAAINRLIKLKHRPKNKSFILLCANLAQASALIDPKYQELLNAAEKNKKISTTWICPANPTLPSWLSYNNNVALRISSHPLVIQLCKQLESPITSTSANLSGEKPCSTLLELQKIWQDKVDFIIPEKIDSNHPPSQIIDLISKKVLRK